MNEFTYNNAKNASTGHTSFELNCGFHPQVSYKKNVDLQFKLKAVDELAAELKEVIADYRKNF